jgi:hypothetical protein
VSPLNRYLLAALTCCGVTLVQSTPPPEDQVRALGPPRELAIVADFGSGGGRGWTARAGENTLWALSPATRPGSPATTVRLGRRTANDLDPNRNWFALERGGPSLGVIPRGAAGLVVELEAESEATWWISLDLVTSDGKVYSAVIADEVLPGGTLLECRVSFERFRTVLGEAITTSEATKVRTIRFAFGGDPGKGRKERALFLYKLAAYGLPSRAFWLTVSSSHPENGMFFRGEEVQILLALHGSVPDGPKAAAVDIRDYSGTTVYQGSVPLADRTECIIKPSLPGVGYYEIQASLTDQGGPLVEGHSDIIGEGTVPDGLATISVLPETRQEISDRMRSVGRRAFFGLHDESLGLADHIGIVWRLNYSAWSDLEPARPDRSIGPADWATVQLRSPPFAADRYQLRAFSLNIRAAVPPWAQGDDPSKAPAFANWEDALALVADEVRVEKHRFPLATPRIYGVAWEPDLNMGGQASQAPRFNMEDLIELCRRVRDVVKRLDPDALMMGPAPASIDSDWFEAAFKAGLLRYLDAIETHAYDSSRLSPEESDLPRRLAQLKRLVHRYSGGKSMPIFVTERGEPGTRASRPAYREQAALIARTSIILKGEGVQVFVPFHGFDFDSRAFGLCFNRELEGPGRPWATRRVSPKPAINALATCARLLEGATPAGRLSGLGSDVLAYRFTAGSAAVIAVWTTGRPVQASIPSFGAPTAQIVDMIGRNRPATVREGAVDIKVTTEPSYLVIPERRR